jgi:DNA-binding transcriptional LysR family regulator
MTNDFELRHLRYFIAVAEELSFTRAAARLGIAQPPLSVQIRDLERHVGSALFHRTPRVALTEAGSALLDMARLTMSQIARGVDEARRAAQGDQGSLAVGIASSVVLTELPSAFQQYSSRFPRVDLQLREMHSGPQIAALQAGTIDVGILRDPILDDTLLSRILIREGFVAVLPRRHPLAKRKRLAPGDLAGESFVLFPRELAPGLHDTIHGICRRAGFVPRQRHEALEWHTIAGLVSAELGVSIAPAGLRKLTWTGVEYRSIHAPGAYSTILACWRNGASPRVQQFIEVMCDAASR